MPPRGRAVTAVLKPVTTALRSLELAAGSVILVAVSGGPDSVALLQALAGLRSRLRFGLVAAHLNHRLRGADAARDEAFVRELCARLGVAVVVGRARGLKPGDPNLEERARTQRHAFLNRTADRHHASLIALAHHADDQAETVLMRLLRGSGAAGLAAMAPRGPGRLWRPLLGIDRATLIAYLEALGATWMTDATNASPRILRNRMRLELLPLLEREFAPGISGRLVELAGEMRALDTYLTAVARAELASRCAGGRLAVADFARLNPALAQAVVREFLREGIGDLRRIARDHIEAAILVCIGREPGAGLMLPGGWYLRREYGFVMLTRTTGHARAAESYMVALAPRGTTRIAAAGFTFKARLIERRSGESGDQRWQVPTAPMEALFDADQLRSVLAVRNFIAGDRIAPDGMRGTRKVQDLFVDRKVARRRRTQWPLVMADDQILWIPGIARSRVALITAATRRAHHLRAAESIPK